MGDMWDHLGLLYAILLNLFEAETHAMSHLLLLHLSCLPGPAVQSHDQSEEKFRFVCLESLPAVYNHLISDTKS